MPTQTFFRLPEEKQQRILDAAKKEFSEHALPDASIANIVKEAGIPRGSFYQYFEDKDDLYFYYFETLRQATMRDVVFYVQECQGDLFEGFELFFTRLLTEIFTGGNAKFYRHLFLHMNYKETKRISPELMENSSEVGKFHQRRLPEKRAKLAQLLEEIDRSKLVVKSDKEIELLLKMMMSCVFSSVGEGYRLQKIAKEFKLETVLAEFSTKLKWLRYGVSSEKRSFEN